MFEDLGAETLSVHEIDPGSISDEDHSNLVGEVMDDDEGDEVEEETSAVEASVDCLEVQWEYKVFTLLLGLLSI
jgi:hypothetical protein